MHRLLLPALLLVGCGSASLETADDGSAAVSDCSDVTSTRGGSGRTIEVAAHGCTAASADRLLALLEDDARLAEVAGPNGRLFTKYAAGAESGELDGGRSRSVKVTFNVDHKPSTTLLLTVTRGADGVVHAHFKNTKSIGFLVFTAIDAGNLDLEVTGTPRPGGLVLEASTTVVVNGGYENKVDALANVSPTVVRWIQDELR
jgi:hypothetical protein